MNSDQQPGAWLSIAWGREVRRRSVRVSLLVGTLLVLINQSDLLLAGGLSALRAPALWAKIVLTYLVPYSVATWSSVQAIRHKPPLPKE